MSKFARLLILQSAILGSLRAYIPNLQEDVRNDIDEFVLLSRELAEEAQASAPVEAVSEVEDDATDAVAPVTNHNGASTTFATGSVAPADITPAAEPATAVETTKAPPAEQLAQDGVIAEEPAKPEGEATPEDTGDSDASAKGKGKAKA